MVIKRRFKLQAASHTKVGMVIEREDILHCEFARPQRQPDGMCNGCRFLFSFSHVLLDVTDKALELHAVCDDDDEFESCICM